jgi:hypothetical protein
MLPVERPLVALMIAAVWTAPTGRDLPGRHRPSAECLGDAVAGEQVRRVARSADLRSTLPRLDDVQLCATSVPVSQSTPLGFLGVIESERW